MSAAAFAYIRDAVLQTIGISCGAIAIAIVFGIPLALIIARGGFGGRAVAAAVLLVRAIPDLVLAVVAVVAVGLGPAAGLAALGVHYAAVVAKLYAEILNAVRREAAEALRATGATSTTAFLVGMLPAAWSGMVGFGAYAFESTVRASVIVGVVGAGGIGALLIQQLNLADYRGFAVSVAALVVLVVVTDAASSWLRFHARPIVVGIVFACIAGAGVAAFAFTDDPPWATIAHAPAHLAAFVVRALPPDAGARDVSAAVGGVGVSLAMAVAGTVGGTLLALPFAWLASAAARARATFGTRTPAGRAGAFASSAVLALVRAVPPIALGLIGLSFLGIGPVPGVFALVLHTAGVLGKLLAESLELAERTPAQALAATGATPATAALVALVPAAAAAMAAHTLYRLEWNVRAATTLGMIGAGGIGQAIFNAQQLLFDRQLSFYVIVAIALVLAIDAAGSSLRSRWHVRGLALA